MKLNPLLQKIESLYTNFKSKKNFHNKVKKGDYISVIYYDLEKEQIHLQQYMGFCTRLTSKGLNTKLEIHNSVGNISVTQQFYIYSKSVLDLTVLRKK